MTENTKLWDTRLAAAAGLAGEPCPDVLNLVGPVGEKRPDALSGAAAGMVAAASLDGLEMTNPRADRDRDALSEAAAGLMGLPFPGIEHV